MLRHCFAVIAVAAASWAVPKRHPPDDAYRIGEAIRTFHPAAARECHGARQQALVTRIWCPVEHTAQPVPHDIGPPGHPVFRGIRCSNSRVREPIRSIPDRDAKIHRDIRL